MSVGSQHVVEAFIYLGQVYINVYCLGSQPIMQHQHPKQIDQYVLAQSLHPLHKNSS